MLKGEFEEPKEHTIARYLCGLNYEIANVINFQLLFYLHDVMKLALKVKKQNKVRGVVSGKYEVKSEISRDSDSKTQSSTSETSSKQLRVKVNNHKLLLVDLKEDVLSVKDLVILHQSVQIEELRL